MCSDFTDLSGDAWAAAVSDLGEDLAAEDPVVADVEVLPFDDAGLDLGEVEAGDERVLVERHQPSLVRSSAPAIGPPPLATAATSTSFGHLALAGLAAQLEARPRG